MIEGFERAVHETNIIDITAGFNGTKATVTFVSSIGADINFGIRVHGA